MKDRLLAIVVMVGALIYLVADYQLPRQSIGDPLGPKIFPAVIGVGLLLSGLLLLVEKPAPVVGPAPEGGQEADLNCWPVLIGLAVWTAVYYVAFEPVGYIIATPIYLFALLAYFHRRRHLVNLTIAAGFTAVAYALFHSVLGVALPLGLFES